MVDIALDEEENAAWDVNLVTFAHLKVEDKSGGLQRSLS